jgi:hypothetical protein
MSDRGIGIQAARRAALGLINPELYSNEECKGSDSTNALHAFTCVCGICLELPTSRPSNVEIAKTLGCSTNRVRRALDRWYNLSWRERHGWLVLAEAWNGRASIQRG